MFKYTRAAFTLITKELKLFSQIFKVSLIIFSAFYYSYAIIFNVGNIIINTLLLALTISYSIFEFCTKNIEDKDFKKISKKIYSFSKLFLRAVSLGGTIYGLYSSSITTSPITTVVLTLMIILWILQILLELVTCIMEKYLDFVITGIKQDFKEIKGKAGVVADVLLAGGVVGAVKKITGIDQQPKEENQILEKLDKEIEKKKIAKAEARRLKKYKKKETKKNN